MLSDSQLPQRFGAEALSTAIYLRNRCPTKALKKLTPHEAWTGEKPLFSHLRRFVCTAYSHVAKDRRLKLDSKAKKCIFLGYGADTKGFRLYDLSRRKVILSRDAVFNEEVNGVEKEQLDQERDHTLVDIPDGTDIEEEAVLEDREETPQNHNNGQVEVQQLRQSRRERTPPDHYGVWINAVQGAQKKEPSSVTEALADEEKEKWKEAMDRVGIHS